MLKAGKWAVFAAVVAVFCSASLFPVSEAGKAVAEELSGEYVNYVLEDDFSEYNRGNWSLYQEAYLTEGETPSFVDPISFSGGINFSNDFTEKGGLYEGARVVSNVCFSENPKRKDEEKYTIFETSFVVYQNNKENRAKDVSFGVLFGLPEKDSSVSEGVYFELKSAEFALYSHGEKLEPEYLTENGNNGFGGYIEYDFKLEVRLVANSMGEVYVYFGFPDGKDISEAYCKFTGVDAAGFLGYTATSHVPEKTAFSVNFDNISLSGGTIADNNFTVISARVNPESLTGAIVSEKPVSLLAEIVTAPNLPKYHRAVFSVVEGEAEIRNGDELYIHDGGKIVLRTASFYERSVYSDYSFSAVDLQISSITITNTFEDITVDTQPIRLIAEVDSNSFLPQHNTVRFEVISGNAEIFCDKYLKILGAGTVILRATSSYLDDVFTTVTFEVTDPDAQYIPGSSEGDSCGSVLSGHATAGLAAAFAGFGIYLFMRKIKKN